jgi:prepilin-type N-terminal cleavage/methylation domain-containing protein
VHNSNEQLASLHFSPVARRHRQGFTLVEMLVAMTVSLIMIYGMVQFFVVLSNQVVDGRAIIEMAGQQRAAAILLQSDLEGTTAPSSPWLDPKEGLGYLTIREGWGYDLQPIPGLVITSPGTKVRDDSFGDMDDVVALTTRSTGDPFVGTWRRRVNDGDSNPDNDDFLHTPRESPDAEVVWFSLWGDPDLDGLPQALDTKVYRRQLLVIPSIGVVDTWTRPSSNTQALLEDFLDFYNYNDISCRAEISFSGTDIVVTMRANSLGDLTKRENRYGCRPLFDLDLSTNPPTVGKIVTDALLPAAFPFELYRHESEVVFRPTFDASAASDAAFYGPNQTIFPNLSMLRQREDRTGNDVVASHMVGFDVKVYDSQAWVITDVLPKSLSVSTLVPSDPGYPTKTVASDNPKSLSLTISEAAAIGAENLPHVGRGAYVDLNYWRYLFNATSGNLAINSYYIQSKLPPLTNENFANSPNFVQNDMAFNNGTQTYAELSNHNSNFAMPPAYNRDTTDVTRLTRINMNDSPIPSMRAGWRGLSIPTWDTWPTHYENNNYSEDGRSSGWRSRVDQGNNGLDDDNNNGVDDIGERETSPPYLTALKSIRITLRMVESDTQQARQVSITHDFSQ